MRPNTAENGQGRAPARPPARHRPAAAPVPEEIDSDDDWVAEEEVLEIPNAEGAAAARPVIPVVEFRHPIDPDNPHQLPLELLPPPPPPEHYDLSDEEGEDHTGFWQAGDLEALVLGLNHYRHQLKGKFTGTANGKERKARAWAGLADYVNQRCATRWTAQQCKGKARRFCLEVKQKYNVLRRELNKTGNRVIPDHMYLNRLEEMTLDYIGVEGVIGIPGIQGVPLRPDLGRDYLETRAQNARRAWDHGRENRPDYRADLPMERIHLERRRRPNNQ